MPEAERFGCPDRCHLAPRPCEHCAQFVLACEAVAPGRGPIYGGRAVLEVIAEAMALIDSGRVAEGANQLRTLLRAARMDAAEPGPVVRSAGP
jgi:hypothetical protein